MRSVLVYFQIFMKNNTEQRQMSFLVTAETAGKLRNRQ